MSKTRNEYLDAGFSDSDHEQGYDSEAAEYSKAGTKRRKLSSPPATVATTTPQADIVISRNEEEENGRLQAGASSSYSSSSIAAARNVEEDGQNSLKESSPPLYSTKEPPSTSTSKCVDKKKENKKISKPGVIYLSSLPPYLKPSALRNLLTQRGFSPISRLFLAPWSSSLSSKYGDPSRKSSSRQLYTEGWIEFASKKTAKRCAETLNASTVGGRKGGFYHDDMWNMKYLRGVGWDDLMAQVREERREEEVRRMEERGQIARETKEFIEGVERGKMARGMERSRQKKRKSGGAEDDGNARLDSGERRTWWQYKVKENRGDREKGDSAAAVSEDVMRVLGKIF